MNINVKDWFAKQIAAHVGLSSDAYHAQELPRTTHVRDVVVELADAASSLLDEGGPEKLERLRVALAAFTPPKPEPYVTITHGMRGYFAVLLHWNEDHGGFWEPWNTSDFSYSSRAGAERDGKAWAEAEGLEFKA